MPPDRADTHPFNGFRSYADDSPRDDEPIPEAPMAAGWADSPRWREMGDDLADGPSRVSGRIVAMGAVASLLGAGALGWSVLREPTPQPATPSAAATPAPAQPAPPLQVVLTEPPPPAPLPESRERLEVLPKTPPPRAPLAQATIPVAPTPGVVVAARAAEPPAPSPITPSASEAGREASAEATPVARRFNACSDAPTRAYDMVCRDMRLAEADRRMKRAYRAALAAGVPGRALAQDQDDWLEVREDAARIGPHAVADIYRQRTRELQAMAAETP